MKYFFILTLFASAIPLLADPPAGYYDSAAGLTGPELQQALHDIIDDQVPVSYDEIWDAFYTTDDRQDSLVWDMYSDIPDSTPPYTYVLGDDQGGSAGGEGQGYNREHSWPKSWFGGEVMPMYTDLFHIVPTDIYVNNRRANYPYGEVDDPTWTSMNGSRLGPCSYPGYSGTVFEPIDAYKGDFARNYFYMATRYLGEDSLWPGSDMVDGAVLRPWAEDMLIEWHLSDPVSAKETERNDAVYAIQGNRNPFIDHPEFVLLIYDPTGIEQEDPLVAEVTFQEPVPNPFSSSTTFQFVMENSAEVHMAIYDVSGHRIRSLEEGDLTQGYHSCIWNGEDERGGQASPGIYFCILRTESCQSVQSVLKL